MKLHNVTGLRESLEQLQTEELQTMLQAELERDTPDPDSVRLILSVLEDRESQNNQHLTEQKEAAWQQYQKNVAGLRKKPIKRWNSLIKVASVILIASILVATIPGQAQAETFWEMLQRWSNSVLEYFDRDRVRAELDYVFKTDNEGLQQVYDAVVELGVTEPMVPMWLPEECELTELIDVSTPMATGLIGRFAYNESELIYKILLYAGKPAHQYYKDDTCYETYEREGVTYNLAQNCGWQIAVWAKDNIECSITIDCQEDTLRRILNSIYVMEDS